MTAALADELTRHKQAYLQLFRSVLAKRPMDAAAKEQLIQKLSAHMDSVIRTTDDLIPRIPEFATMLGVGAAPLSTFIGTNFLQALQMVAKQQPQAAPVAPRPSGKPSSFLVEIIQFSPSGLPAGSRFETAESGFLKLITPQGEVMSQSFLMSGDAGAPEISYDAAPSTPAASSPSPVQDQARGPAAPQAPRPPQGAEKSILKEILERFGNQIDIPEKLVPKDLGDESAEVEIFEGEPDEEEATVSSAPASAASPGAPPAERPAAKRESSILREMVEKFANDLDIHEKLVPRDLGDDSAEEDVFATQEEEAEEEPVATPVVDAPIPFPFTSYLDVIKRLQEFQASGDQGAYRAWLANEASSEAKVLVAVRNFERKEKAGGAVNWSEEYYNLSTRLACKPAYVERVHKHIIKLSRVHALWNQLTQTARSAPPALMEDLKRLWPQIKLLFDEGGTAAALSSRLQILLLAVPDPSRKASLKQTLDSYLQRLAAI